MTKVATPHATAGANALPPAFLGGACPCELASPRPSRAKPSLLTSACGCAALAQAELAVVPPRGRRHGHSRRVRRHRSHRRRVRRGRRRRSAVQPVLSYVLFLAFVLGAWGHPDLRDRRRSRLPLAPPAERSPAAMQSSAASARAARRLSLRLAGGCHVWARRQASEVCGALRREARPQDRRGRSLFRSDTLRMCMQLLDCRRVVLVQADAVVRVVWSCECGTRVRGREREGCP